MESCEPTLNMFLFQDVEFFVYFSLFHPSESATTQALKLSDIIHIRSERTIKFRSHESRSTKTIVAPHAHTYIHLVGMEFLWRQHNVQWVPSTLLLSRCLIKNNPARQRSSDYNEEILIRYVTLNENISTRWLWLYPKLLL